MKTLASITLNHSTLSCPQTSMCRQVPSHQVLVQCLKRTQDGALLMSSQGPLMVHGSHFKEQALSVYSLASSLQQPLRLVLLSLLFRWGSQGMGWWGGFCLRSQSKWVMELRFELRRSGSQVHFLVHLPVLLCKQAWQTLWLPTPQLLSLLRAVQVNEPLPPSLFSSVKWDCDNIYLIGLLWESNRTVCEP